MIITPISKPPRHGPPSPLTNLRLSKALECDEIEEPRVASFQEFRNAHERNKKCRCGDARLVPLSRLVREQKERNLQYFKRYLQSKKKQLETNRTKELLAKRTNARQLRRTFNEAASRAKQSQQQQNSREASYIREKLRASSHKSQRNEDHSNLLLKFRSFERQYENYRRTSKNIENSPSASMAEAYRRIKTEQINNELCLSDRYAIQLKALNVKNNELKERLTHLQGFYRR